LLVFGIVSLQPLSAEPLQGKLAATVHNLTPGGPGTVRASQNAGLCVFCHTPHNAKPSRGLWNRQLPGVTYDLYQSSSLRAETRQPTGSSRLCLSCHDGILAMGNIRQQGANRSFSIGRMQTPASLGTDLSDDHPVSVTYDSALALRQGQLLDPHLLTPATPLDPNQQLQCSTCHDPHDNINDHFLRVDQRYGNLCLTCHELPFWEDSSHATSPASWNGSGNNPWPVGGYATVAENACLNCHRPHAAGHPERLLAQAQESENCTNCHDASVAQKDVRSQFDKAFHHPVETDQWRHQPRELPTTMPRHVSCTDCHNPHAATSGSESALLVSGSQRGVSGVSIAGNNRLVAEFKYEVCLKCHGLREPQTEGILRQDSSRNIRIKIDPGNASFHPIAAPGKNPDIQGLNPQYTSASQIDCSDCHTDDEDSPLGSAPSGPHGSNNEFILARAYQVQDPGIESFADYALCYGCHDRATLLSGNGFPHQEHLVEENAPCAVCHDAHGSRDNPALINFMLRTSLGAPVVAPSDSGRLEFIAEPAGGSGSCSLSCHGENHEDRSY